MVGVWTELALVAGAEQDQPRVVLSEDGVTQPQAGHRARSEILDDHVGRGHQLARQLLAARMLQVERDAALTVVVEVENARPLGARDVVLERRGDEAKTSPAPVRPAPDEVGATV